MDFKKNLAALLKVKTLVTLMLTVVFCVMSIRGDIPQPFMTIYAMVIAFYFGTQHEKTVLEKQG